MNAPLAAVLRCLVVLALVAAPAAHAARYRVDLIVFIDRTGPAGESTQPLLLPDVAKALEPFEATPLRNVGIEVLPDAEFGLVQEWQRLKNSRNHQPLLRLAWLQKDPPGERGPRLRLRWGDAFTQVAQLGAQRVFPVDGSVSLLASRYLHLDAELVYTQADGSGDLRSFRLGERRRLRRDELHHLDSPRLGILARATRAPEAEPAKPASVTPKKPPQKPQTR
jgi:hypothetical protein